MVKKKANSPDKMPKRYLYVEGGGDRKKKPLASEVRKAFKKLFEEAGVPEKPAVVVCGGRQQAYKQFCTELSVGHNQAWLLVDAEDLAPVLKPGDAADPWAHVKTRDQWDRPKGATDEQLHLMNVTMETWLLCDREALLKHFKGELNVAKLPADDASLETKPKETINMALDAAITRQSKAKYDKGQDSFNALQHVKALKLRRTLFWADRFLLEMGAPIIKEGSASRKPEPVTSP
jgi:hypothetical protein